jgi:hypothetical protein
MAKWKMHVNLLLSCPGDIADELPIIREIVREFNQSDGGLHIDLKHWQSDAVPSAGGSPQSILNSQLVCDADMIVAIFWTRFGTKTENFGSGTEEEIRLLMERRRNVFLYFSDRPAPPSKQDARESGKIAAFREKFKNQGLYWTYDSLDEFGRQFRRHIFQYFHDRQGGQSAQTSVYAAFEEAAAYIIRHGYYFDNYYFAMNAGIDEKRRVIEKTISRQFELYAFDGQHTLESFVLSRHKSNNVRVTPDIRDIGIDIDHERENDFTVEVSQNKSALAVKRGFISVTQVTLNKPLHISAHSARKIAISYTVQAALSNKVHTVCLDAPCKSASFYCQIDGDGSKYKVAASGFGATNLNGFDCPVETDTVLSMAHHNWLLPRDGVMFCLLRSE